VPLGFGGSHLVLEPASVLEPAPCRIGDLGVCGMAVLASTLDGLAAERLDGDVVSGADLVELLVARARMEAELLRRIRVWDDHRVWSGDGALSASGWLAHHGGLHPGTARRLVHLAHRLGDAPVTEAALQAGRLSVDQATALARASTAPCTVRFQADEQVLVDQAQALTVPQLQQVVRHWRTRAEAESSEVEVGADPGFEGRHLHASVTWDATVALDGVLDPDSGAVVLAALDAAIDADRDQSGEDRRSRPQRRVDALALICRHYLDTARLPVTGGERPHLAVTVDLGTLTTGQGSGRSDHGVTLSAAAARLLACDAAVHPIRIRGSQPLDIGRRTRTVPTAVRRALVVRDGGCRFPGCDRPPAWTDAHHITHWANGGATALANLILLCRRHHRLLHHGWTLTGTPTKPTFTRPDGTTLPQPRAGPPP